MVLWKLLWGKSYTLYTIPGDGDSSRVFASVFETKLPHGDIKIKLECTDHIDTRIEIKVMKAVQ